MKKDPMRIVSIITAIIVLVFFATYLSYITEPSHQGKTSVEGVQNVSQNSSAQIKPTETETPTGNPEQTSFINQILNSEFTITSEEPYQFVNGVYYIKNLPCKGECTSSDPYPDSNYAVTIDKNNIAIGQLDEDGGDDAVVILGERYGGTGYFIKLLVFRNDNGKPVFVTSKDLGDRTTVETIKVKDGLITLTMLVHAELDGACCPTLPKTATYELVEGTLLERN